jgi:ubiquinone/menaquinone biosynthesis C-methylase UbiE
VNETYLMESEDEALRLDVKTDVEEVREQALWAGLKPGMNVADLGCGPGKTTYCLNQLAQPGGKTIGMDISEQRIKYAKTHYGDESIEYVLGDIQKPLDHLGSFDFIWVRFVLEYYLSNSFEIVKNITNSLKTGGLMCLIDLDYNCLRHFGLPARLEKAIISIMGNLAKNFNFDPYAGVKLYSFLFDLGYRDIEVHVSGHNIKTGYLKENKMFNWAKKAEIASQRSGYRFEDYPGGFQEFYEEFRTSFESARVFHYTPLIICRGRKP